MDANGTIDALAIGSHPDDAEFGAGGTLLRLKALGYRTGILDMTRGEMGTRGTPEERASEAEDAARELQLDYRGTLDLGDGGIRDSDEARAALVRALRRLRPRIVFTHYWEEPHPDHVATAQVTRHAIYLSGLAKFDAGAGQERHRPSSVLHYGLPRWVPPTFVVDIGDWHEQKRRAVLAHRSQLHDPGRAEPETALSGASFLERLEARSAYFGSLVGARFGEAFLLREALRVDDPVALLSRPMDLFY